MAGEKNKNKMVAKLMNASSDDQNKADHDHDHYPKGDDHHVNQPMDDDDDDPETELMLQPAALRQGLIKGKDKLIMISRQKTSDQKPKSDDVSKTAMKSHANFEGIYDESLELDLQLQLGSKSKRGHDENDPVRKAHPTSPPPPSKKMKPLVITPNNYVEKAKMKSVMKDDDNKQEPFSKFPPMAMPNARGKAPLMLLSKVDRGRDINVVNNNNGGGNNLWKRAKEFSEELLAKVLVELLKHMPMVYTNGGIPERKITKGFLYNYNRVGATIICTCHGHFFSSAEFVEHAGGGRDLENPSKLITIEFFPN